MKVAIVNSFFPPWRGGAETYAYNIAKNVAARGNQITVVCAADPLPPGKYRESDLYVERLGLLTRLYGTPIISGLHDEISKLDIDVIHGNFPSPLIAYTVARYASAKGVPAVLTWHNDLPPVSLGAKILVETHDHLVLPRYIRVYRRIIATSETYARQSRILPRFGDLVTVIPNGVDCERFRPDLNLVRVFEPTDTGKSFVLLFVGALTKWHRYKGLDILLQALSLAAKTRADIRLVVVGDGGLRQFYETLSEDLGVQQYVKFAGDVPDADLPAHYAAADVLILPSTDMSEGFGLTILEANASGKPAIASNVGGIPSVIQDGHNGILVKPSDPQALADAILRLRDNPALGQEMGRNGRKFAEQHDWKIVASQTEAVYREAISQS